MNSYGYLRLVFQIILLQPRNSLSGKNFVILFHSYKSILNEILSKNNFQFLAFYFMLIQKYFFRWCNRAIKPPFRPENWKVKTEYGYIEEKFLQFVFDCVSGTAVERHDDTLFSFSLKPQYFVHLYIRELFTPGKGISVERGLQSRISIFFSPYRTSTNTWRTILGAIQNQSIFRW